MPRVAYFSTLPDELLVFIAAFLLDRDRRRLERTDKRFHQLMRSIPELQPRTLVIGPKARPNTLCAYLDKQPYTRGNLVCCDLRSANGNAIFDFDLSTIGKELARCPSLRTLKLGSSDFDTMGDLIGLLRLKQLTALDMTNTRHGSFSVSVFSDRFLPNLHTLSIRGCNLPRDFETAVPSFYVTSYLRVVDVRGTLLDVNPKRIAASIGAMQRPDGTTLRVVCNSFLCTHRNRQGDTWVLDSQTYPLPNGKSFVMDCVTECQDQACVRHRKRLLNLWE